MAKTAFAENAKIMQKKTRRNPILEDMVGSPFSFQNYFFECISNILRPSRETRETREFSTGGNQERLFVQFVFLARGKPKPSLRPPRESGDPVEHKLEARESFRARRNQNRIPQIWIPDCAGMTEGGNPEEPHKTWGTPSRLDNEEIRVFPCSCGESLRGRLSREEVVEDKPPHAAGISQSGSFSGLFAFFQIPHFRIVSGSYDR
jgi:hypothetical protein